MKSIKIYLFLLLFFNLRASILPENGSALNYIQVFFKWNQIPFADQYKLIINSDFGELEFFSYSNSLLLTDNLDWGLDYTWEICGINSSDIAFSCSESFNFSINPLPSYYPSDINISNYDSTLSQPGITVMDFESLNFSSAIDVNGSPIWFIDRDGFYISNFTFTNFLQNGNLTGFSPGKGYEIDLDGNIYFETPDGYSVHHDFNKTSNNTYFFISATIEDQYCPEECLNTLPDEIPWQGDIFRELDSNGIEIWSWNTFEEIELSEYNPYYVEVYNGWNEMDWTHSNSVFFDNMSNSVFVSIRNLSRITKIDYANKNIIWNMGETDFMNNIYFEEDLNFSQQHSVQVLANGNLLFFDNHRYLSPELSRCIEVKYNELDYSTELVWEHVLPIENFTGSRGECDRLENGNTLITAGRSGATFEVTPNNDVVWQLTAQNYNIDVTMYRSARIPNLYPVAFSLEIENLFIENGNNYVETIDDIVNLNIYNSGWGESIYIYQIKDEYNNIILSDSVFINSYENVSLDINTNNLMTTNLYLEVFPSIAPEKLESINFMISSSTLLGDMNLDGFINILDIVILSNNILSNENNATGDMNQDSYINILDIVILVNIILRN